MSPLPHECNGLCGRRRDTLHVEVLYTETRTLTEKDYAEILAGFGILIVNSWPTDDVPPAAEFFHSRGYPREAANACARMRYARTIEFYALPEARFTTHAAQALDIQKILDQQHMVDRLALSYRHVLDTLQ